MDDLTQQVLTEAAKDYALLRSDEEAMSILTECLLRPYIMARLLPEFANQAVVKSASGNIEKLYRLYLAYLKGKRGEDGYKLHRRSERDGSEKVGQVVAISKDWIAVVA